MVGADTDTVVDWEAEPPDPVHVKVNLVAAVRLPVLLVPLAASDPLQPPDAAHEVAFVDDQLRVDAAPLATVVGLADKETVGAGEFTVTVADCDALPPLPVQVSTKVAFALSAPVDPEPLTGSLPDHAPEAAQEAALVEDQVSVAALPLATVLGLALSVRVGAGEVTVTVADCAALPPAPVQVKV